MHAAELDGMLNDRNEAGNSKCSKGGRKERAKRKRQLASEKHAEALAKHWIGAVLD